MQINELVSKFGFHPAKTTEIQNAHAKIRNLCLDLAEEIANIVPDSQELDLAITKLEEVMMWSNAGIARRLNASNENSTQG